MRSRALTVRLVVATALGLLLLGHLHHHPDDAGLAARRAPITVQAASPGTGPVTALPAEAARA